MQGIVEFVSAASSPWKLPEEVVGGGGSGEVVLWRQREGYKVEVNDADALSREHEFSPLTTNASHWPIVPGLHPPWHW